MEEEPYVQEKAYSACTLDEVEEEALLQDQQPSPCEAIFVALCQDWIQNNATRLLLEQMAKPQKRTYKKRESLFEGQQGEKMHWQ